MTHVVTDNCSACRFTDCVSVCPVNCFHASFDRVYIDPTICIDCGACVPVCPVGAISHEVDLRPEQRHWLDANRIRAATLPVLRERTDPLPGAEALRAALGY